MAEIEKTYYETGQLESEGFVIKRKKEGEHIIYYKTI